MAWIGSMVFALLVLVIGLVVASKLKKSRERETASTGRLVGWIVPLAVVSWIGFHSGRAMVYQIPAGHVGVVYEFGGIKSQIGEGLQTIAPWRSVLLANIQIQTHLFEELTSFSQETQDVFVEATLNIRVSPETIQELYRTVGPNYFLVLVKPRVAQNFKDEIVRYKSVEVAPNREVIRRVVRERLEKELSPYSIEVKDLLLNDVDFRPEFKAAIEAKQIATQKALEEEQRVVVERHRAEQAVERARGEGSAILAIAEKQSEANRKLSESLTPELVQYALIQKLGDKIEVMILPAGQNFILSPDILKKKDK